MKRKFGSIELASYEDLFSTEAERVEARKPHVDNIPLEELTAFPDHPFYVKEDDEMKELMESVANYGVLVPALARPKGDHYEIISGHRRLAASRALGLDNLPVIVKEMTDGESVIAMVDSNLQRERVLPSEKAKAYKMKMEALGHQGLTCGQLGHKSRDTISSEESGRQIQRYIRLTYLLSDLLRQVDEEKIAFNPAVELSYLTEDEQAALLDAMEQNACTPSHAQAIQMKKLSQAGMLTPESINQMLAEPKANQQPQIRLKRDDLKGFFPAHYSDDQIRQDIVKGLELLKRQRERKRDVR